jgi:hypothetical protein
MIRRHIGIVALLVVALSNSGALAQNVTGEALDIIVPLAKVGASPSYGSVIALGDGRLLWTWGKSDTPVYGNYSSDKGKTWSDPIPLRFDGRHSMKVLSTSLVRLRSGALGQAVAGIRELFFHVSRDEGKTWSQGIRVDVGNESVAFTNDRAIVLSTGRIVLPAYTFLEGPKLPVRKPVIKRYGAEFDAAWIHWVMYSYVFYSDDEGKTWTRSDNEVFITLAQGTEGTYPAHEPAVAELSDGRLVMFVRTNLGRFYRSYSEDKGKTWLQVEPTPLIGPPAPCSLTRIPGTNDLLAVWTQVSSFEVMQGLWRHRLSCAISKDGGVTWQNFKNLESLDDTTRVEDEVPGAVLYGPFRQPLDRMRYHRAPGPLRASYPTCLFVNGNAIITYGLSTLGEKAIITRTYGMDYDEVVRKLGMGPDASANKVRIMPIQWFYTK